MGQFITIAFAMGIFSFCGVLVAAFRKSKRQLLWERLFTWSLRVLVVPLIGFTILGLSAKGYNAEVAHLAYGFLVAIPFNFILLLGWIGQEVHFYKFKQRNAAV